MEMKKTEFKLHPCYCGGEMRIKKVLQDGGMDGMFWNWELTCSECGLTKTYAADAFYGRKYKAFEEVVNDWNKEKEKFINDVLDKIRAEILDEAEYAYADFDKYKEYILHIEPYDLPDDDFRYGLRRAVEIIDKYKAKGEE